MMADHTDDLSAAVDGVCNVLYDGFTWTQNTHHSHHMMSKLGTPWNSLKDHSDNHWDRQHRYREVPTYLLTTVSDPQRQTY